MRAKYAGGYEPREDIPDTPPRAQMIRRDNASASGTVPSVNAPSQFEEVLGDRPAGLERRIGESVTRSCFTRWRAARTVAPSRSCSCATMARANTARNGFALSLRGYGRDVVRAAPGVDDHAASWAPVDESFTALPGALRQRHGPSFVATPRTREATLMNSTVDRAGRLA